MHCATESPIYLTTDHHPSPTVVLHTVHDANREQAEDERRANSDDGSTHGETLAKWPVPIRREGERESGVDREEDVAAGGLVRYRGK